MMRALSRLALLIAVAFLITSSAFAKKFRDTGSANPSTANPTTNPSSDSDLNQQLTQAYLALEKADHDYHGHRVNAMHAISEAGKALGNEIKGKGPGHEQQVVSDEQLKSALQTLQNLSPNTNDKKHNQAMKHIKHAIDELNTALKTK